MKFTTTLKNISIYFGPKNAPECTSKHAKFQNHLGEASQTPPAGGGNTLPHPSPCIPIAGTPHFCYGYLRFSSCYFFTNWKPCNQKSSFVAMFSCLGMDNSSVYIINRIIHGRLEIWNLSSRVHIWYLTRSLCSLDINIDIDRYECEHSKINSISLHAHVLFSI